MFKVTIITPRRTLFEDQAESVFLPGAAGEFEVLELHKALVSLLREGSIIIDWKKRIPIKKGAVRVAGEELVAIVEQ